MDFLVRKQGLAQGGTTTVIIQDNSTTVFHSMLLTEEDNIEGWYVRLIYLQNTRSNELLALLNSIPQLLIANVSKDAHPTYLHLLYSLFRLLNRYIFREITPLAGIPNYEDLYKELERSLFHFEVKIVNHNYEVVFSRPKEEMLKVQILRDKFDSSPVQASQAMLVRAYHNNEQEICYFIDNHIHYQSSIVWADDITRNIFLNLSKALVNFLTAANTLMREESILGMYISLIPDICKFIIVKEQNIEEQKKYLEIMLDYRENENIKKDRLGRMVEEIKRTIPQGRSGRDAMRRLIQIISLISDYYLRLYNLKSSADFWDQAKSGDPLLYLFLKIHRRPLFLLLSQIPLLGMLSFFAFLHWRNPVSFPLIINIWDIQSIGIIIYYLLTLGILILVLIQIFSQKWLYSQLILPRLLGATIVGLLPLVLNDQSWQIGTLSNPSNLFLLALFTYAGTFIYMYIEVYNSMKFFHGRSVRDALRVCSQIFLIGFSETLFIVTVVSTLIFPVVAQNMDSLKMVKFGVYAHLSNMIIDRPWLAFGFFPTLIFLWTGIALFIGSFVQLLWQERQVTDPI